MGADPDKLRDAIHSFIKRARADAVREATPTPRESSATLPMA